MYGQSFQGNIDRARNVIEFMKNDGCCLNSALVDRLCKAGKPEIKLDNGNIYKPESCWEDICHAITEAHHMVYLVGWSIYHKVRLVREPSRPLPRGGDLTLGELLKYKSEEGVRVLLLVWDDKASHDKVFFKSTGIMMTHDEETKKFFKHSSVMCVLAPRYASSKISSIKQQAGASFVAELIGGNLDMAGKLQGEALVHKTYAARLMGGEASAPFCLNYLSISKKISRE
ncbi:hypothetical protein KIW84_014474 [Lathyrus oleraceus]|uniref:Uncharacterized protein n=1 Tax=Pisum sativum TaxID=3888 RepID=A0A9D5GZC7_PEA|nr:hypothetical protein KIW84_014473 [Pisum sativum]KAI5446644.1 hypothetical protein KIW84_014474 [Pisum sativum]